MCRAIAWFGSVKADDVLRQFEEHAAENPHGVMLYDGRKRLRTMDYKAARRVIAKCRPKGVALLHVRFSTNQVKPSFVHGWRFKGKLCMHNGVGDYALFDSSGNDSLDFFKEWANRGGTFDALVSTFEDMGSGSYFALDEQGGYIVGDSLYVADYGGCRVFASQGDCLRSRCRSSIDGIAASCDFGAPCVYTLHDMAVEVNGSGHIIRSTRVESRPYVSAYLRWKDKQAGLYGGRR